MHRFIISILGLFNPLVYDNMLTAFYRSTKNHIKWMNLGVTFHSKEWFLKCVKYELLWKKDVDNIDFFFSKDVMLVRNYEKEIIDLTSGLETLLINLCAATFWIRPRFYAFKSISQSVLLEVRSCSALSCYRIGLCCCFFVKIFLSSMFFLFYFVC